MPVLLPKLFSFQHQHQHHHSTPPQPPQTTTTYKMVKVFKSLVTFGCFSRYLAMAWALALCCLTQRAMDHLVMLRQSLDHLHAEHRRGEGDVDVAGAVFLVVLAESAPQVWNTMPAP